MSLVLYTYILCQQILYLGQRSIHVNPQTNIRLFVQVKAIEQQEFPQKLAFQCDSGMQSMLYLAQGLYFAGHV